jgi:hypothetical protein
MLWMTFVLFYSDQVLEPDDQSEAKAAAPAEDLQAEARKDAQA